MRNWRQILRQCFRVQRKLRRRGKIPLMWGEPGVGKTVTIAVLPKGTYPPITPEMEKEMRSLVFEEIPCEPVPVPLQRAILGLVMEKPKKRRKT